jgi:hypothetical protein
MTSSAKEMFDRLAESEAKSPLAPLAKYKLADKVENRVEASTDMPTRIIDTLGSDRSQGTMPSLSKDVRGPKDQSSLDKQVLIEPVNISNMDMLSEMDVVDKINSDPQYQALPDNIKQQLINQTLRKRAQLKKLRSESAKDQNFIKFIADEFGRDLKGLFNKDK